MIIDLSKPRGEYFELPTASEICRGLVRDAGENITLQSLVQAQKEGRADIVVAGTHHTLDGILARDYSPGITHNVDDTDIVAKLTNLGDGQILVLPPEVAIEDVRKSKVYDERSLLNIFAAPIKRMVWGSDVRSGKPGRRFLEKHKTTPHEIVMAAWRYAHEHKEKFLDLDILGYTWISGKDNGRRIVLLYEAVQGAELRTFQNNVAFNLVAARKRKELRTGTHWRTGKPLSDEQKNRRIKQIQKYEQFTQGNGIREHIERMRVDFDDLIEIDPGRHFADYSGCDIPVPSRSRRYTRRHRSQILGIPLLPIGDERAYSRIWLNLRPYCHCENPFYHSNRRTNNGDPTASEAYIDAHSIAALHTLRRIHESDPERQIPFLPFPVPSVALMDIVHRLTHQTVVLTRNPETDRLGKRELNKTEINMLLCKVLIVQGPDGYITLDPAEVKGQGYGAPLHNALVRYVN